MGGGYGTFNRNLFYIYAPEPENFHDAHSIIFEVLAEQGYVGLLIFLSIGILTFFSIRWIYVNTRGSPELNWCRDLALMVSASLIGYVTGGLFVGLAYFDLPYHLIAIVVILRAYVKNYKESPPPVTSVDEAAVAHLPVKRNKLGVRIQ